VCVDREESAPNRLEAEAETEAEEAEAEEAEAEEAEEAEAVESRGPRETSRHMVERWDRR
jgi:hypothetical protein